ncbi:LOG family protein [Akkermansiaceae bacterium]|nr:LOG family protein [Akkermansiaceae bacterium]MDA7929495.1 LOG family protein [Akkermansiaceae bacterium]MDB4383068.1 LOG family protein [Akkermansiaceae bacterium]MDB4680328.1 LOG family protein [Akkermansiaceae bacterium]MDB4809297.1 LOG family protein [bacterium]
MPKKRKRQPPLHRDLTAGMVPDLDLVCNYIDSTGDKELDARILELAKSVGGVDDFCLLAEMISTAVGMARGTADHADFKLANRALKEMKKSSEIFGPFRGNRKVALFGSARTKPEEKEYQTAVEFSRRMVEEGFMTITGAGPGIMAAGNEGATAEHSFGLNITLPFEASANEFISGDPKLIDYNYFFTRKLAFVKEADAGVGMPGGVGTQDEVFEALTLIQTGKAKLYPIVCLDAPGGTYWKAWKQFVEEHLFRLGMISESDFSLFKVTDDVEEAIAEITGFYANFHSYRYVGDRLVIRLQTALSEAALKDLNQEFVAMVKSGDIKQGPALKEESNEPELAELPRIVLRHRRCDFGLLRGFINAINEAEVES